jgi:5-methylcytosine-specific restriction protein A
MPNRPGRLCVGSSHCGVIVHPPQNLCAAHQLLLSQIDARRRGTSHERGYDARHRRWRKIILWRDPLCKGCGRALSTHADHIVPLSQGGDWQVSNGQGLCQSCHNRKTGKETQNLNK